MSDPITPTPAQLKKLIAQLAKQQGGAAQGLEQAIDTGNVQDFVQKNLNEEQAKTLQRIMSDQSAVQELLQSPQAQKLMNMLKGRP